MRKTQSNPTKSQRKATKKANQKLNPGETPENCEAGTVAFPAVSKTGLKPVEASNPPASNKTKRGKARVEASIETDIPVLDAASIAARFDAFDNSAYPFGGELQPRSYRFLAMLASGLDGKSLTVSAEKLTKLYGHINPFHSGSRPIFDQAVFGSMLTQAGYITYDKTNLTFTFCDEAKRDRAMLELKRAAVYRRAEKKPVPETVYLNAQAAIDAANK